jgi:predicted ABC-type ATPase
MNEKNLYIIAGCNGAGKTTASFTILPEIINCKEFVNADEIAKGFSPFQPEKVAFESGWIMLNRINELLKEMIILLLKQHSRHAVTKIKLKQHLKMDLQLR